MRQRLLVFLACMLVGFLAGELLKSDDFLFRSCATVITLVFGMLLGAYLTATS
jgi:hypothetical protein